MYELYGALVHSGSALGGHYYAYIKDFESGDWHNFNDSSVSSISESEALKACGGSENAFNWASSSANAYMLMYRRVLLTDQVTVSSLASSSASLSTCTTAAAVTAADAAAVIAGKEEIKTEGVTSTTISFSTAPLSVSARPRCFPSDDEVPAEVKEAIALQMKALKEEEEEETRKKNAVVVNVEFEGKVVSVNASKKDTVEVVTNLVYDALKLETLEWNGQAGFKDHISFEKWVENNSSSSSTSVSTSKKSLHVGVPRECMRLRETVRMEPFTHDPRIIIASSEQQQQQVYRSQLSSSSPLSSTHTFSSSSHSLFPLSSNASVDNNSDFDDLYDTKVETKTTIAVSESVTVAESASSALISVSDTTSPPLTDDGGKSRLLDQFMSYSPSIRVLVEFRSKKEDPWPLLIDASSPYVLRFHLVGSNGSVVGTQTSLFPKDATLAELAEAAEACTGVPRLRQRLFRVFDAQTSSTNEAKAFEFETNIRLNLPPFSRLEARRGLEAARQLHVAKSPFALSEASAAAATTSKAGAPTYASLTSAAGLSIPFDKWGRAIGDVVQFSHTISARAGLWSPASTAASALNSIYVEVRDPPLIETFDPAFPPSTDSSVNAPPHSSRDNTNASFFIDKVSSADEKITSSAMPSLTSQSNAISANSNPEINLVFPSVISEELMKTELPTATVTGLDGPTVIPSSSSLSSSMNRGLASSSSLYSLSNNNNSSSGSILSSNSYLGSGNGGGLDLAPFEIGLLPVSEKECKTLSRLQESANKVVLRHSNFGSGGVAGESVTFDGRRPVRELYEHFAELYLIDVGEFVIRNRFDEGPIVKTDDPSKPLVKDFFQSTVGGNLIFFQSAPLPSFNETLCPIFLFHRRNKLQTGGGGSGKDAPIFVKRISGTDWAHVSKNSSLRKTMDKDNIVAVDNDVDSTYNGWAPKPYLQTEADERSTFILLAEQEEANKETADAATAAAATASSTALSPVSTIDEGSSEGSSEALLSLTTASSLASTPPTTPLTSAVAPLAAAKATNLYSVYPSRSSTSDSTSSNDDEGLAIMHLFASSKNDDDFDDISSSSSSSATWSHSKSTLNNNVSSFYSTNPIGWALLQTSSTNDVVRKFSIPRLIELKVLPAGTPLNSKRVRVRTKESHKQPFSFWDDVPIDLQVSPTTLDLKLAVEVLDEEENLTLPLPIELGSFKAMRFHEKPKAIIINVQWFDRARWRLNIRREIVVTYSSSFRQCIVDLLSLPGLLESRNASMRTFANELKLKRLEEENVLVPNVHLMNENEEEKADKEKNEALLLNVKQVATKKDEDIEKMKREDADDDDDKIYDEKQKKLKYPPPQTTPSLLFSTENATSDDTKGKRTVVGRARSRPSFSHPQPLEAKTVSEWIDSSVQYATLAAPDCSSDPDPLPLLKDMNNPSSAGLKDFWKQIPIGILPPPPPPPPPPLLLSQSPVLQEQTAADSLSTASMSAKVFAGIAAAKFGPGAGQIVNSFRGGGIGGGIVHTNPSFYDLHIGDGDTILLQDTAVPLMSRTRREKQEMEAPPPVAESLAIIPHSSPSSSSSSSSSRQFTRTKERGLKIHVGGRGGGGAHPLPSSSLSTTTTASQPLSIKSTVPPLTLSTINNVNSKDDDKSAAKDEDDSDNDDNDNGGGSADLGNNTSRLKSPFESARDKAMSKNINKAVTSLSSNNPLLMQSGDSRSSSTCDLPDLNNSSSS